jgi:hypothetical protein
VHGMTFGSLPIWRQRLLRTVLIATLATLVPSPAGAQPPPGTAKPAPAAEDVAAIRALITAYYGA